jgi:drug/metabolite transporter (DMT)-like permease
MLSINEFLIRARGYIYILLATFFWGISATIAKFLFTHEIDTVILVQTRVTISAAILLIYFIIFNRKLLSVRLKDVYMFMLLGILGVAGSNFNYYFTIQQTNVAVAILIQYLAPLLVLVYAAATKEESLTPVKIIAAVVSILGCYLAVSGNDFSIIGISKLGLLTGIASAFCWAFTTIYTRHILKHYKVWTIMVYSLMSASVFWLFFNSPINVVEKHYSLQTWGTFLIFAIISIMIPHALYFSGLKHIAASRAIITGTFEPIVAIVSSFVLLNAVLTPVQVVGAVLVIAAILILQLKREEIDEIETDNQDS